MNILKTSKVLPIFILAGIFIYLGCNSNKKDAESPKSANQSISEIENANETIVNSDDGIGLGNAQNAGFMAEEDTTFSNEPFEGQFDDFYKKLYTLSLPLSLSQVKSSQEFIEGPSSLYNVLGFLHTNFVKNSLIVAKLPEYKNIKVIIVVADYLSGQGAFFLCTFLNNKFVDNLLVNSEGEEEINGSFGLSIKSFSITNNYEIQVKDALYPDPANRNHELNVELSTYIITDEGKFQKKQ